MNNLAKPSLVIKGATVVDRHGERRADVAIVGSMITTVGNELEVPSDAEVLDASGAYLLPAFVDLHTHLREPGGERAETVETGARAGVLGGYSALVAMPNTTPTIDSAEVVHYVRELAKTALLEVVVSASITVGRLGEQLSPMRELAAVGVRLFTDDGRGVQSEELMRRALQNAKEFGVLCAQHCEDESHAKGGHMHEGAWSSRLGILGQPASAEEVMVARDLALVRELGASMHFLHLSTAGAIDLVRSARTEGLRVTAEATPHHLSLTDALVASYDAVYKVNPPLRPDSHVNAVRAGLFDGTIDAIATDHAPHSEETKDEPFDCAPPGMIGLETAFAVAYTELVAKEHLYVPDSADRVPVSMTQLVQLFSTNPARIAGLCGPGGHGGEIADGASANLCVFDPTERWTVSERDGASSSHNTPFASLDLRGKIRHTVVAGEAVVIDALAQR